jgi:Tol biopolymer transport system component
VGELVVSDRSGANISVIGEADAGHGFAPAWSTDGTQIAFVKRENESDSRADSESSALIANILIVDVSTGSTRPVSYFTDAQTSAPAWSADGQFVAYTVTSAGKISLWVNDKKLLDDVTCCAVWLER